MSRKLLQTMTFAFCFCLTLFCGTVTAWAGGDDLAGAKYSISISEDGDGAVIEIEDVAGTDFVKAEAAFGEEGDWQDISSSIRDHGAARLALSESGVVYVAVTDHSGKVHVKSQHIDYAEPQASETVSSIPVQEDTASQSPPNAASNNSVMPTDGTGTVIENSVKTPDEREFFTITTDSGHDYYVVVDKQKTDKNVYLLSEVTDADLMGLAKSTTTEDALPPDPAPVVTPEPEPEPEPTPPADPTPKKSGGVNPIVILVLVAAAGAAGWYFKIYKPKQDSYDDTWDDADTDDGFDDDFDNESEV
ncbi:DUF4366 domain-containing protein [Ruminococcaceae bacterium OttesenSCG-928-L11]|nr:DUF4366 domain-containing protein [Ruminococcaceae bacterium OttesenSCG-928-L11]